MEPFKAVWSECGEGIGTYIQNSGKFLGQMNNCSSRERLVRYSSTTCIIFCARSKYL